MQAACVDLERFGRSQVKLTGSVIYRWDLKTNNRGGLCRKIGIYLYEVGIRLVQCGTGSIWRTIQCSLLTAQTKKNGAPSIRARIGP